MKFSRMQGLKKKGGTCSGKRGHLVVQPGYNHYPVQERTKQQRLHQEPQGNKRREEQRYSMICHFKFPLPQNRIGPISDCEGEKEQILTAVPTATIASQSPPEGA